jgi:hypothetical protein
LSLRLATIVRRRVSGCILRASLVGLAALSSAGSAHACRPFDGTDANVVDVSVFELELGPTQFYRRGARNYLVAPSTALNLGVARNLEVVADFERVVAGHANEGESRVALDTDVLLKWLMRPGTVQGRQGISVALEAGPLLPEFGGDEGFGAQANLILSYSSPPGTLHLNEEVALSRQEKLEVFSSVILEGAASLAVRPVAELFVERELKADATTYSALLGAIWSAAESLSVDGGLRLAREDRARALEVRIGFTWTQSLWSRSVPTPRNPHASLH